MRVKNKEIVCFTTDKSGRWSCDTPENYKRACRSQLADQSKTQRITEGEHNEAEKVMNCQALALLRMLGLGDDEKNDNHTGRSSRTFANKAEYEETKPNEGRLELQVIVMYAYSSSFRPILPYLQAMQCSLMKKASNAKLQCLLCAGGPVMRIQSCDT